MNGDGQIMDNSYIKVSQVFLQQKWLILAITVIFTLLCAFFIYKHKPSYEAKVVLGPLLEVDNVKYENNLTDFYTLFASHAKQFFYNSIYLSSSKKTNISTEKLFKRFSESYKIKVDNSHKIYKYIVTVTADSPNKAIKELSIFTWFIKSAYERLIFTRFIKNAYERPIVVNVSLNKALKIILPLQCTQLENARNFFQVLININEVKNLNNMLLVNNSVFNLSQDESPILLENTNLEPKFKKILTLGLLGGLLLGFFAGACRMGLQKKTSTQSPIKYQFI